MGHLTSPRWLRSMPVLLLVTAGGLRADPPDARRPDRRDAGRVGRSDAQGAAAAGPRPRSADLRPVRDWIGRVPRAISGARSATTSRSSRRSGSGIKPTLSWPCSRWLISLAVAIPIGIISATQPGSALDLGGTVFALFGIWMPGFLFALLLIFLFGVTLHWLPISGYVDPFEDPVAGLRSLTLPAMTLGLALAAVITRTLRSSMLETLSRTTSGPRAPRGCPSGAVDAPARAQERADPGGHGARAAARHLIGGAVITEYIFALPGVGRLVVDAVFARDYPLVQGVVLLIAVGFIAEQPGRGHPLRLARPADPASLTPGGRGRRRAPPRRSATRRWRPCGARRARGGARSAPRSCCSRCARGRCSRRWSSPYDPLKQDLDHLLAPPERAHLLGTDNVGRDVLARVIWGTRVSLMAGLGSVGDRGAGRRPARACWPATRAGGSTGW